MVGRKFRVGASIREAFEVVTVWSELDSRREKMRMIEPNGGELTCDTSYVGYALSNGFFREVA
jgi:hypothetical protein